jgi:hypothetical protein
MIALLGFDSRSMITGIINAQGLFFFGIVTAGLMVISSYIVLDTDVMRQKKERGVSRISIVQLLNPTSVGIGTQIGLLRKQEKFFWRVGVALSWVNVLLGLGSLAFFVAGGMSASALMLAARF